MAVNITNLPLSDPLCANDTCLAYKAGHAASQAQISWASQFEYGHYTTWYYIIILGLATLIYGYRLIRNQNPHKPVLQDEPISIRYKALALARSLHYRRFSGRFSDALGLPSFGILAFLLLMVAFLVILTFVERPYYRLHRGFGSPPLAVRTGLMAIALTPIIVALAGKANIITLMTGISHEKLNVVHRWVSYMCLFLSIVHTVPFIVAPLKDGGAKALHAQYYKTGGMEYTGTPPFVILVAIVLFSIPYIRQYFYNFFYKFHLGLAIVYLGLMFWHAAQEMDSWAYLWATLAVWGASILARVFVRNQQMNIQRQWLSGWPATIKAVGGDMTRVEVFAPRDFHWTAGQHCFLRFPSLAKLQNHPFTIASIPYTASEKASVDGQALTFYIRSYRGLTSQLLAATKSDIDPKPSRIWVDGPYGGVAEKIHVQYGSAIFVAGGGGITACLPWLLHTARSMAEGVANVRTVTLVWVVREEEHLRWISEELSVLQDMLSEGGLRLRFYVTEGGDTETRAELSSSDKASDAKVKSDAGPTSSTPSTANLSTHHIGRPLLGTLLPTLVTGRRVVILGCGPESMKTDISNAVAGLQSRVMKGESEVVSLHTETFGW
ncbi:uncharacterized protein BDZ99DRAFT_458126 [Mytilinidion resinicola]|uniref:ferric-chelate reductase (NADPH) n=1 Tax=Mytilinidion resinicola TaxID=574789 RepID=A0A6A6Z533_9PEZI|nr:uncharacterized protein BDZ99DRAFT_458126 [Mytilinidion resinicola]KAF2816241.1 hypothetical protein BDZ99DRAFT_458126 [Mytilinidion resinicola]